MAPRETRLEGSDRPPPLRGDSVRRLREQEAAAAQAAAAKKAVVRRAPAPTTPPATGAAPEEGASSLASAHTDRQVRALTAAAASGVPFCQVCREPK